jgi:hypothetical protein
VKIHGLFTIKQKEEVNTPPLFLFKNNKNMNLHRYILFVILNFVCFLSCTNAFVNKNDLKGKFKATHTLKKNNEGGKKFVLDRESVQQNRCIQLVEDVFSDSIYFTFLNTYNYSIYFYDFKTGKFLRKIKLDKEGPNGVNPYAHDGYYIASYDSIYYYSHRNHSLYLLNHKGEKYHTINYMTNYYDKMKLWKEKDFQKNRIPPMVQLSTGQPMYKTDGIIYLCGQVTEELGKVDSLNLLLLTTIDTRNGDSIAFHFGYPKSYGEGNWGEAYFREVFWCMNPTNKSFVVSFPNDHYIYQTDLKQVNKIYAGSMYAGDIKSIDTPAFIMPKSRRLSHYFENYSYSSVIYDRYRNVYYRMVEHPWKDYNTDMDWRPWLKQVSIIILDENFNFMGETKLDMEYRFVALQFMVTEDGLLLYKQTDDEDEWVYDLFTLTKL